MFNLREFKKWSITSKAMVAYSVCALVAVFLFIIFSPRLDAASTRGSFVKKLFAPSITATVATDSPAYLEMKSAETDKVIAALKGKNLRDFSAEAQAYYKDKSHLDKIMTDMDELSFSEECLARGRTNISDFGNNYISEGPMYFSTDNFDSFSRNLAVSLALQKNLECLTENVAKVKTPIAKFYYYQEMAKNLAASFYLKSVVNSFLGIHADWCARIEDQTRGRTLCEQLGDKNMIIKDLKSYYKITGHVLKDRAGNVINENKDALDTFILGKMDKIGKTLKPAASVSSSSDPFVSAGVTSYHGLIETIDDLLTPQK
jgi:hypothetical protein